MEVISQSEAKTNGLKKYFTGKPCKYGHIDERNMHGICITCHRLRSHEWQNENREKTRKVGRLSYKNNKEKRLINSHNWAKNNPEKVKLYGRKSQGLPEAIRPCPENCEICGNPETKKHKSGTLHELSLDHDHVTGSFRGWLCSSCNLGLGKLGDRKECIQKVLDYLNKI
jgi:hypothetical protein